LLEKLRKEENAKKYESIMRDVNEAINESCIYGLIGRDHICSENFLFAKASTDVAIPDNTFEDVFKNWILFDSVYQSFW
ncbi:12162_t:CDS:2, partial [Dentiscutata erythropus]